MLIVNFLILKKHIKTLYAKDMQIKIVQGIGANGIKGYMNINFAVSFTE